MKTFQVSRFISVILFLIGSTSCFAQIWPKAPLTWWPDSTTGLMWSGTPIGYPQVTYVQANSICDGLTLSGYSNWRLPTVEEYEDTTKPVIGYGNILVDHPGRRALSTVETDYNNPVEIKGLKFVDISAALWTSTPGSPGQFLAWTPSNGTPSDKPDYSEPGGHLLAFCVRPMDPELLQIAKEAHPATPISAVTDLNALVLLGKSENAMATGSFQEALDDAKQVLLVNPKHVLALEDLALAYGYLGQWDEAITTLQAVEKMYENGPIYKKYPLILNELKWAQAAQKEAATDPNTTPAWGLIYRADAEQQNKQYEDAVAAANQVIQMEPAWPEGYQRLGNALGGLDQWPDAIAALTKAEKLDKHGTTGAKVDLKNAVKIEKKEAKK